MSVFLHECLELGMFLAFGSLLGFCVTVLFMWRPVMLMLRMAARDGRCEGRAGERVRMAGVLKDMAVVPGYYVLQGEFSGGPYDGLRRPVRADGAGVSLWDDEGVVAEEAAARYVWRGGWRRGCKIFEFDGQALATCAEGRGTVPGDD